MNRTLRWSLIFAGSTVLAIVLTPPVFAALRALNWVGPEAFPKVLRRMLLVPVAIVLFGGIRPWRDGSLASYGLLGERARWRSGVVAACVSLAVGVAILAWHFAEGWLAFEDPLRWGEIAWRVVKYIGGGLAAGVIEEWLFRGWLFRRISRRVPVLPAALLASLLFAAVHSFKPTSMTVDVSPDVSGALTALATWATRLVEPAELAPTLVGLFLLGMLLQALYLRSGTLWVPIGVHGAGIFLLHVYGAFTERSPERTWAGSKWLLDGPPVWALFALLAFVLWPRGADVRSTR